MRINFLYKQTFICTTVLPVVPVVGQTVYFYGSGGIGRLMLGVTAVQIHCYNEQSKLEPLCTVDAIIIDDTLSVAGVR